MSHSRWIADYFSKEAPRDEPEFRKRVEWLMLLRLIVTTFLLGVTIFFQLSQTPQFHFSAALPLYVLIGATFVLGLLYAVALPLIANLVVFSFFQVMVDTVYFTALIYFTGGALSAFTLIYIFPIITAGILLFRRGAMVTAAAASLLLGILIVLQFYRVIPDAEWPWVNPWSSPTPGFVLWVLVVHFTLFFLVAFLAGSMTEQLRIAKDSLDVSASQFKRLSDLHTGIVRSVPSGIITTDESDRITYVNASGTILLVKALSELVSLPLREVFPVISEELEKNGKRKNTYLTIKEIDGEQVHLELTVSELRTGDDSQSGHVVVFQDVTQLKKMEERVKASERQAAIVRLAAGMAHEIRNPLAALRGASELLSTKTGTGAANDRRLLDIVIRESDRLNALLGDFLLTVSPKQQKKETVEFSGLVQDIVDLFSKTPQLGGDVSLETLLSKGVEVEGDAARLKQVVWNLLTNALEATLDGGTIRVILDRDWELGEATLTIHDTGGGIPHGMRDRIFEPFATTKEKGTGLGLSVVLSIVEAHDGTLEVESEPESGTSISIRFPLASQHVIREEGDVSNA